MKRSSGRNISSSGRVVPLSDPCKLTVKIYHYVSKQVGSRSPILGLHLGNISHKAFEQTAVSAKICESSSYNLWSQVGFMAVNIPIHAAKFCRYLMLIF